VHTDLETFHYGSWLLERGYDFTADQRSAPLFGDYYRFQCTAIKRYFGELAEFAREYGRQQGREVLVSGNFFNVDPHYLPLSDDCDLIITEMRNTTYRQPEWYRYVAAFAGDKDVVVVENPYGGVVPELLDELQAGRGFDRFRLSLYEGAAFGANMTVPYGSWMGSRIEDAFYPPHDVATEVQQFLADNDHLFSKQSANDVAVVFSVESNRDLIRRADSQDNVRNARDESVQVPYREVTRSLSGAAVPFDVVLFPDGVTAADRVDDTTIRRYASLILPSCAHLTAAQAAALERYLDTGGHVVVIGELGTNLPAGDRQRLLEHPSVSSADLSDLAAMLPRGRQLTLDGTTGDSIAANIHRLTEGSAAVHLVNYAYEPGVDAIETYKDVELAVQLPLRQPRATLVAPGREPIEVEVRTTGAVHTVVVDEMGAYTILVLHERDSDAPVERRELA
jgi:hypothetical protein